MKNPLIIISLSTIIILLMNSCSYRVTEKMVLSSYQKKYDQEEINNRINQNFKNNNDSLVKISVIKFSEKLLDENQRILYQDEDVTFSRSYFQNRENIKSEFFLITPKNPQNTIYYFIGNLDNIFNHHLNIIRLAKETNSKILCLNYRGYGFSDGEHSLETQRTDNQNFLDYTKNERTGQVWTIGYSLGTIYSTYLGSENNFDKIVLLAPFSNTKETIKLLKKRSTKGIKVIAAPFVKLTTDDYLLNISNNQKLENYNGELIIMHAQDDASLPFQMSLSLMKDCKNNKKKLIDLKNGGHNAPFKKENWTKLIEELK